MDNYSSVTSYLNRLSILVNTSLAVRDAPINLIKDSNNPSLKGTIFSPSLKFKDGATLKFSESIDICDGILERLEYSYHYQREDFFFRYERDPRNVKPIIHEEYHLHVKGVYDIQKKLLRFKTHATSFREVFDFIFACLYSPDKLQKIIKSDSVATDV